MKALASHATRPGLSLLALAALVPMASLAENGLDIRIIGGASAGDTPGEPAGNAPRLEVALAKSGAPLISFGGLHLVFRDTCVFVPHEMSADGDGAISFGCLPPADFPDSLSAPKVSATFSRRPDGTVHARYAVEGIAEGDGFQPGLCMVERRCPEGTVRGGSFTKGSFWVRDPDGGLPHEEPLGAIFHFANADGGFRYAFAPGRAPNFDWQNDALTHLPLQAQGDGAFVAEFDLVDAQDPRDDASLALALAGRCATVTISTPRDYNLFEGGEPLLFTARVANASAEGRDFDIAWTVRDFDGGTCSAGTRRVRIDAGGAFELPVEFDPVEPRGLYFAEVVARASPAADAPGEGAPADEEVFARTNLARLPPYRFRGGPDNSPFGLSAYWPLPSEEAVQRLMDRMGVMWVRLGDGRLQHPPRIANHLSAADVEKLSGEERAAWIEAELEGCRERRNPCWEFCNELNMSTAGIALKSNGIGHALLAPQYDGFVREIARIRKEKGYGDIQLLSFGMAGFDEAFMDRMKELGTWELLDGFCLHPGRGNYAVDYPFLRPERGAGGHAATDDASKAERFDHSDFWNYLGAVRGCQEKIAAFGAMPLYLTEVYTPTFPNSFWEDTPRASAENTVLMYAFIKADGVKCGFYYQLFDSVWYDQLGVNPRDREYYFGLLNRDMSPKPAFMGYVAIAEALDEAEFVGWIATPRDTTHAMAFRTPRGALAVAWDRSDGYVLTRRPPEGKRFLSPEAWEDKWETRVDFALPVLPGATAANAIGQERPLEMAGGTAIVRLSGAPQIIRGLDLSRVSLLK